MRRITWFLLFVFASAYLFAVEGELREPVSKTDFMKSYRKATGWFSSTQKFSVSVAYASYKDHSSLTPFERSSGVYMKDGKKVMTNIMGIKTVENENVRFSVDTTDRIIIITNRQDQDAAIISMEAFESMLDQVKALRMQKLPSGAATYFIEFKPDALYAMLEITLNEKGLLEKETFYYATEMKEETDEADQYGNVSKSSTSSKPRLEISFSNYQTQLREEHTREFSELRYFSQAGKKIILTERYKTYKIKDYRFDLKK
ncbi:MAG TPA: hypothetical protein VF868_13730 [Bacteroidia bacterium]|jgi:hypothetical protein